MIFVEFYGLPGSGKSTIFNGLNNVKADGKRIVDFSFELNKVNNGTVQKSYYTFLSIAKNLNLFYEIVRNTRKRIGFKNILIIFYFLRLYTLKSNLLKQNLNKNVVYISDQCHVQAIASLHYSFNFEESFIQYLFKMIQCKNSFYVKLKCSSNLCYNRLSLREIKTSRLNHLSLKKAQEAFRSFSFVFNLFFNIRRECQIEIDGSESINYNISRVNYFINSIISS
jgi:thymidylate kinase